MVYATGETVDEGIFPALPTVGVGADDRLDNTASFFRTDVRRPRMLETTAPRC
jgi:hypothetical protein